MVPGITGRKFQRVLLYCEGLIRKLKFSTQTVDETLMTFGVLWLEFWKSNVHACEANLSKVLN
jgi:hypothetical protein